MLSKLNLVLYVSLINGLLADIPNVEISEHLDLLHVHPIDQPSSSDCQRALAGFHTHPSVEALARAKTALILEQAQEDHELNGNYDERLDRSKRQSANGSRRPGGSVQESAKPISNAVDIDSTFSSANLKVGQALTPKELEKLLDVALERLKQNIIDGTVSLDSVFTLPTIEVTNSSRPIPTVHNAFRVVVNTSKDCPKESNICDPDSIYRTLTGRCNNLDQTKLPGQESSPAQSFGVSNQPFQRLLRPAYQDGIKSPRAKSFLGGDLPTARQVSLAIHSNSSSSNSDLLVDHRHTLMLMQWGQYVDHDLTSTPMVLDPSGSILDCSNCKSNNPGCHPIPINLDDPFFPVRQKQCIPFTRSLPGQTRFGPRQQLNQATAYLDASSVYGSELCRAHQLRIGFEFGWTDHPLSPSIFKALLPVSTSDKCMSKSKNCFEAGDDRNSEQPGLTVLHTLFMREHNRLAFKLAKLNPDWTNETIFQETRKVVIAVHQHITFNEFLPRILGPRLMREFQLELSDNDYNGYDPNCDATIYNEFATAAFRFGHSLVMPNFTLMNHQRQERNKIQLRNHFHNPDVILNVVNIVDDLTNGLVSKPMAPFDRMLTEELTNHLFEEPGEKFSGMDLAALNIQRGRDHGLPGYVHYVRLCNQRLRESATINSFEDLSYVMDESSIRDLKNVYKHINDIDLFSGGMAERSMEGGLVGQTFGCIIASQFKRLRRCDRFWYESPDVKVGFRPEQLKEIKKESLSSVLCRNMDVPMKVQKNAFDLMDPVTNPLLECSQLNRMDIRGWRISKQESETREGRLLFKPDETALPFCDVMGRVMAIGDTKRVSACVECSCLLKKDECRSIRVRSCDDLVAEVGLDAVGLDPACHAQCPHLSSSNDNIAVKL